MEKYKDSIVEFMSTAALSDYCNSLAVLIKDLKADKKHVQHSRTKDERQEHDYLIRKYETKLKEVKTTLSSRQLTLF